LGLLTAINQCLVGSILILSIFTNQHGLVN
jgi:hypothetical protein